MDEVGDDVTGWAVDGLAAGVLGGAVGTCLLLLGAPQAGVVASAATVLAGLALLRTVKPGPRRFRLPAFVLELEARTDNPLELTDIAEDEPFLLEDRLDPPAEDSRVVRLFAAHSLPTPGELRQRIEDHLAAPERRTEGAAVVDLEVDASAALRQALGDLRRSLA